MAEGNVFLRGGFERARATRTSNTMTIGGTSVKTVFLLDYDFVYNASRHGAPKYMEWYGAFSILVTLVWMYLEILRLLEKIR